MLFIKKQTKGKTEKSSRVGKKQSTYGKTQSEKNQMLIEQFLDEHCDWDSIYFEVMDSNDDLISALYDKKKLSGMLAKDQFLDWRSTLSNVDPLLLNYIQKSIKVNKAKEDVYLQNKENIEQNIIDKYRKNIGGNYFLRKELELSEDDKKVVQKLMVSNLEIEFSEFLYDVKIFELQKLRDKDIVCYFIEIFTLNDPDVVYLYNYPMSYSAEIQDPHTLVVDEFNLIENPFKRRDDQPRKGSKMQSKGGAGSNMVSPPGVMSRQSSREYSNMNLATASNKNESEHSKSVSKSVQRKHDIQKQLFRKYIDNRVVLLIQEQRFPRKLDFVLIEPCS